LPGSKDAGTAKLSTGLDPLWITLWITFSQKPIDITGKMCYIIVTGRNPERKGG
jgi:hypothetical protein